MPQAPAPLYNTNDFFYHFAVDHGDYRRFQPWLIKEAVLTGVAYLTPRADKKGRFLELLKTHKARLMLDSGGFQNYTGAENITFEEWSEFVKNNPDVFDEYVQLDDIGSRDNTVDMYMRALESGLDPHFVDHLRMTGERQQDVDSIYKARQKLCVSGFGKTLPGQKPVPSAAPSAIFESFKAAIAKGRTLDTQVHLLAAGSLRKYLPFMDRVHSVDSAAWDKSAAFGGVLISGFDDVDGVQVPTIRTYTHGFARSQQKPMPEQIKKDAYDAVISANGWDRTEGSPSNVVKLVSIHHIKKYVAAVRKFDYSVLEKTLSKDGALKKALDAYFGADQDPMDAPFTLAKDFNPLDECSEDSGWTVSHGSLDAVAAMLAKRAPAAQGAALDARGVVELAAVLKELRGDSVAQLHWKASDEANPAQELLAKSAPVAGLAVQHLHGVDGEPQDAADGSYGSTFTMHALTQVADLEASVWESVRLAKARAVHVLPIGAHLALGNEQVFASVASVAKAFDAMRSLDGLAVDVLPLPEVDSVLVVVDKAADSGVEFNAQVLSRSRAPGSAGAYVYTLGLADDKKELRKAGKSHATTADAKAGDVVAVRAAEVKPGYDGNVDSWTANAGRMTMGPVKAGAKVGTVQQVLAAADRAGVLRAKPDQLAELRSSGLVKCANGTVNKMVYLPILKADSEQRLVLGEVLVPDVTDAQGDIVSAEAIRDAAHDFVTRYNRETEIGVQHKMFGKALHLVESYIAPVDFTLGDKAVVAGTWIMGVKVLDDEVWNAIKEGRITGFSIGGVAQTVRDIAGAEDAE